VLIGVSCVVLRGDVCNVCPVSHFLVSSLLLLLQRPASRPVLDWSCHTHWSVYSQPGISLTLHQYITNVSVANQMCLGVLGKEIDRLMHRTKLIDPGSLSRLLAV